MGANVQKLLIDKLYDLISVDNTVLVLTPTLIIKKERLKTNFAGAFPYLNIRLDDKYFRQMERKTSTEFIIPIRFEIIDRYKEEDLQGYYTALEAVKNVLQDNKRLSSALQPHAVTAFKNKWEQGQLYQSDNIGNEIRIDYLIIEYEFKEQL